MLSRDCGLKYLPRASAEGKMRALAEAAAVLRAKPYTERGDSQLGLLKVRRMP